MPTVSLAATGVAKSFNRRKIFSGISFSLHQGGSLAVTGRNGSGKSTLMKILIGVLSASKGTVQFSLERKEVKPANRYAVLGFVAPYLQLYDEFTGWENLDILRKVRGVHVVDETMEQLLRDVNIYERRNDLVRTYSSGMKQRLKYAFALIHQPPFLFLDEPTSNLDSEGIEIVYRLTEEQKERGIVVVATNDAEDIKHCEQVINLDALVAAEVLA